MIERSSYERRTPATTVLHTVVREHLESFLADARQRSGHGYGVPRHVERELRNDLACGILAHGFVRVRCVDCGFDRLLAFSCKGRAVCPSCRGRRMADAAAHLVDRVLPCAPYRQWTLSVPWRLRSLLARDRRLLAAALTGFVRAVFRWQRGIPARPDPTEPVAPPPTRHDLRPIVIGTSFMWDFGRLLRRSSFGTDARFYYYDDQVFDVATQRVSGAVAPNDPAWRAWTLGRNLYLVDLYEAYLPGAGYGPFLDQLEAALADRPYVATPR